MSFSTEVELALTVPSSELRSARAQIEGAIGDMSVGVSGEGPAARATGGGGAGAGGRRGRRLFRWARQRTSLMEDAVGLLEGIEDKIGEGGGGGGLIGGALGGVGLRSLLGGGLVGAVTGTVSVAAGKVISITASTWAAGKLLTITAGTWAARSLISITASTWAATKLIGISVGTWGASKIISIAASTWAATKLITIGASTWAASKLITIGATLKAGAASLISVGAAMTVGAAALIAVGTVLTLDALELIDIGAAIEADWDDVVTLEGSIPFEIGQDVAVEGKNNPLRSDETDLTDPGLETGVIDPRKVPILSDAFRAGQNLGGGAESARGSARQQQVAQSVNVDNRTDVTVEAETWDELQPRLERQMDDLRAEIERATGGIGPNP